MSNFRRWVFALTTLCLVAVGAVVTGGASASSPKKVSFKGTLHVAIVTDVTGSASIGSNVQGALAYFDQVNAAGGVDGYKLVPKEYDTQSSPAASLQAVRRVVASKPVAMIGASFYLASALPTLATTGIPAIGDGAAAGWTGHKSLFSIVGDQTSHTSDVSEIVALKLAGATKIALVGSTYAALAQKALVADAAAAGVQIVLQDTDLPVVPNSAEFLTAAEEMKSSGAQAALDIGIEGVSELQIDLNQLGVKAKVIANDEYSKPVSGEDGLVFSEEWANPYITGDPGVTAYKAAMAKYGYGALVPIDLYAPLRWAQAALLVKALRTAGPPFSHSAVVKALAATKRYTADGMVPPVSFPAFQSTGGHCQAAMEVVGTKWVSEANGPSPFICGGASQSLS